MLSRMGINCDKPLSIVCGRSVPTGMLLIDWKNFVPNCTPFKMLNVLRGTTLEESAGNSLR